MLSQITETLALHWFVMMNCPFCPLETHTCVIILLNCADAQQETFVSLLWRCILLDYLS